MKKILTLACAAMLALCCASFATADVTVTEWNWGAQDSATTAGVANGAGNTSLVSLGTSFEVGGTFTNRIGTDSTAAINQTNAAAINSLVGAGTNAPVVGSLNWIQQFEGTGDPDQFRLRNNDSSLNPQFTQNNTQLYWSSVSPTSLTLPGLTSLVNIKNNQGLHEFRVAFLDTTDQWHISQSSTASATALDWNVDLTTELWANYTPAVATDSALLLAPTTGFGALSGGTQAKAFGFFLQGTDGSATTTTTRIVGFRVSSAVPEPGSTVFLGLVALGMLTRRRR